MKQKIIALFSMLSLVMITLFCTSFPAYAAQETDIEKTQLGSSDTYYEFDAETKTLTISGTGATPDFTNTSGASSSQPWVSWRGNSIDYVVVEEGVTCLGTYCFYYVKATQFTLPESLETISQYAMSGTNNITELTLPSNLKTIAADAFYQCIALESITIPSSVTTIGNEAFQGCTALTSVEFENPAAEISIGKKAFMGCSSLMSVTVPKNAELGANSFGYSKASASGVYSDFILYIYRDSPAYEYVQTYLVNYVLLDSIDISEAQTIDCTYYSDTLDSTMYFYFTPSVSAVYDFYSSGDIDVECTLFDSSDNEITSNLDVSIYDLNFKISYSLTAGETYYYAVTSNNSLGDYSVTLFPHTVSSIEPKFDTQLEFSAQQGEEYDVLAGLENNDITVIFDTGYSEDVTFSDGSYYHDYEMTYYDDQSQSAWSCGSHSAYMYLGDKSIEISVTVTHSYSAVVVAPTYNEMGYTAYICSVCGDTYYSDYVESTGIKVTGRAVLMENTDGSHPNNYTLSLITVTADGEEVFTTDTDGTFEFYIDADITSITLSGLYAKECTVLITDDGSGETDLGDIALFNFDYNSDGYVNAKDFAILRGLYGSYDLQENYELTAIDYNHDGVLDSDDWNSVGASNFFSCIKIDESIYKSTDNS